MTTVRRNCSDPPQTAWKDDNTDSDWRFSYW